MATTKCEISHRRARTIDESTITKSASQVGANGGDERKGRTDEKVGHIQLVVLLGNLKHLTVDSDTGGCIMYNVLLDIPFIVNCFVQPFILTILIKTHSVNTWGECALTLYPL